MAAHATDGDPEFNAMQVLYDALESLDDDARKRVVNYIIARLEIATNTMRSESGRRQGDTGNVEEVALQEEQTTAPKYSSFAELYDAAQPKTYPDRALVAGYWLQVCKAAENFDGFSANKELKNLGHGLANITNAIEGLRNQKPSLALQLKKSGKSQQSRKTYKLTVAGVRAVEAMIHA